MIQIDAFISNVQILNIIIGGFGAVCIAFLIFHIYYFS